MTERFSCARAASQRAEPQHGTASTVRRWLLLEQPGPWGSDAVRESRIETHVAEALLRRARELRARLLLLRRHGRRDDDAVGATAFAAHSGASDPWVRRLPIVEPEDLLELDLGPLRHGEQPEGEDVVHPLYLVCTNGAHDVCCAEFGRPLAAAMCTARPEQTWECSHIGGDRFAANLLVLPHGLYYGRVSPGRARRIAELHEAGRVDVDHLRGRSAYPFHVQAVAHHLRLRTGIDEIDGLTLVRATAPSDGRAEVAFDTTDGRRFTAEVVITPDPTGYLLTCSAEGRACPPRYEVTDVEAGPA